MFFVWPIAWADCDLTSTQLQRLRQQNKILTVSVADIIDGDTIRLNNGRLVRLIGINTPEIDHENNLSEPVAEKAKAILLEIVAANNNKIVLHTDKAQQDRHHRQLAHIYSPNGTNIQSILLRRGLGFWIVVTPNLYNMACYKIQEQQARSEGLGIWGLNYYQPQAIENLVQKEHGFRLLQGKIARIEHSARSIWLNFATPKSGINVALRIQKSDLKHFNNQRLTAIKNKLVTARGWLYHYNGQLIMRVHHPAAIQIE
ncbi:MAG: thermonuclease family protein [Gammaproteobacteria bacterium]|nr:thermonuclease family protein [Gammaproteobacteria bacterium]